MQIGGVLCNSGTNNWTAAMSSPMRIGSIDTWGTPVGGGSEGVPTARGDVDLSGRWIPNCTFATGEIDLDGSDITSAGISILPTGSVDLEGIVLSFSYGGVVATATGSVNLHGKRLTYRVAGAGIYSSTMARGGIVQDYRAARTGTAHTPGIGVEPGTPPGS